MNFDDKFKELFQNQSSNEGIDPDTLWANIEQELDTDVSGATSGSSWKLISLVILFFIASTSSLYIYNSYSSAENSIQKIENKPLNTSKSVIEEETKTDIVNSSENEQQYADKDEALNINNNEALSAISFYEKELISEEFIQENTDYNTSNSISNRTFTAETKEEIKANTSLISEIVDNEISSENKNDTELTQKEFSIKNESTISPDKIITANMLNDYSSNSIKLEKRNVEVDYKSNEFDINEEEVNSNLSEKENKEISNRTTDRIDDAEKRGIINRTENTNTHNNDQNLNTTQQYIILNNEIGLNEKSQSEFQTIENEVKTSNFTEVKNNDDFLSTKKEKVEVQTSQSDVFSDTEKQNQRTEAIQPLSKKNTDSKLKSIKKEQKVKSRKTKIPTKLLEKLDVEFDLLMGINHLNSKFSSNNAEQQIFTDLINSSTKAHFGFTSKFNTNFIFKTRIPIIIRTGIEFDNWRHKFTANQVTDSSYTNINELFVDGTAIRNVVHYNSYRSIAIPISIGTTFRAKFLGVGFTTGAQVNYTFAQTGKTYNRDNKIIEYSGADMVNERFAFGFHFNPHIEYKFNRKIKLKWMPSFKYYLNQNTTIHDLKLRNLLVEYNIGVSFMF